MAIKTVKPPIVSNRDVQFGCQNRRCRAVLAATYDDGVVEIDRNDTVVKFQCPHCNEPIYVDAALFRER